MWPFRRRPITAAFSSRRTESASSDRESWLRDADGVGPQGSSNRGITDAQRGMAVRKSRVEYDKAAVYGGVLDRFIDFVLGDGIVIKAKNATVDKWLQEQLKHGWYGRERRHIENLFIDGENLLVVRALARGDTAPTGELRIGALDPLDIGKITANRFDLDDVVALEVRPEGGGESATIPVVRGYGEYEPKRVEEKQGEKTVSQYVLGAFWRVNARGVRGVPVLLRTLDHAADLDNLVTGLVSQLEYVRRLWLHATVAMEDDTTADGKPGKFAALRDQILSWAKSLEPGSVLVTTGGENGVKVNPYAPKMEMADAKALYDVVLEMCLGGHGIPRFWFGSAHDASRTSAAEQGTPIFRAIQSRQAEVKANVEMLVRAVLKMGEASGVESVTADAEVDVTMATVATRDSERDVREIAALGASLSVAVDHGALTDQEAADILREAIKSKTFGSKLTGPAPKPEPKPEAPPALPGPGAPPPPQQQPGATKPPEKPPAAKAA